jgi:hypothetical protein
VGSNPIGVTERDYMKFTKEIMKFGGELFCNGILDILQLPRRISQVVFSTGNPDVPQVRWIMLSNEKITLTKEEIHRKMLELKPIPGKDNGFCYTYEGFRIIVVPEEMSMQPNLGAPLGTPMG